VGIVMVGIGRYRIGQDRLDMELCKTDRPIVIPAIMRAASSMIPELVSVKVDLNMSLTSRKPGGCFPTYNRQRRLRT